MALSFFALLDDVAALLDDVSLMVKVATKKTAGVLGDDLALNANQLSELSAQRELPVIWAVTKGSLVNKAILVPAALLLSAFLPVAVPIILLLGGGYLCFEGVEKVIDALFAPPARAKKSPLSAALEAEKISSAIRTDFILSAEIVVIALASFVGQPLPVQILGLSIVAVILTLAVYGVVAVIVKMDDVGLYWQLHRTGLLQRFGAGLLWFAPKLLRILAYVGTAAMFVVGGHLWLEHLPVLHHAEMALLERVAGGAWLVSNLLAVLIGMIIGLVIYGVVALLQKLTRSRREKAN